MADPAALFWELATPWLEEPDIERGTVMRLPCLRVGGEFAAGGESRIFEGMVVKLPAERVAELIMSDLAEPFPSPDRPFREWAAVGEIDADLWRALIAEAVTFARGE